MKGIWAKGLNGEMNKSLVFILDLKEKRNGVIKLTASSCYKVFADGVFLGFGPHRAAKGYSRFNEYEFKNAKRIAVEVAGYNIKSFWLIKAQPFFYAEVVTGEKTYTHDDFVCRALTDRVQKVPRYSYQRCFSEVYKINAPRGDYSAFPLSETEASGEFIPLDSNTKNPLLLKHSSSLYKSGAVYTDYDKEVWRDRQHFCIGKEIDGFKIEEWEDQAIDDLSRFTFDNGGDGKYMTFDFGRAVTGFINLKIKVGGACRVYAEFDEVLWKEAGKGEDYLCFYRNTCANGVKWSIANAGEYEFSSFEPYTARFLRVIVVGADNDKAPEFSVNASITDYENPEAGKFKYDVSDKDIETILDATRATFAQNAVDVLTDCPSRERAGWLCDSTFTSVSERLFTGYNRVEQAFLENYALSDGETLPKGLVHMCYPANLYDNLYIPNWAMWYVYEVAQYAEIHGFDETVKSSYEKVKGIIEYFKTKTNEFGLIEDLEGWVFIEWSKANDADRVCGVNVAANFCFSECLIRAGKLYNEEEWQKAGVNMRNTALSLGYDGKFFVDNLIRKDGKLVRTNHYSEVCQYYAFWFNSAKKEDYPELYAELMNNLGLDRKEGYLPEIEKPNAFFGIYMRLDLLMRDDERQKLYKECKGYFLDFAKRTGTLWENAFVCGSLVHGFASYAAKWIVYALTGYDVSSDVDRGRRNIGVNAEFEIPRGDKYIVVKS